MHKGLQDSTVFLLVFQATHIYTYSNRRSTNCCKNSLLLLEALQDNQRNHLGEPDVDVQTSNETISRKAANQIEIYHVTVV